MTGIDWIILGVVLLFSLYGAMQGFLVGVLSLGGFAVGAVIGTRIGPLFLADGSESPYAPLFGLLGAVFAGAILATGLSGVAGSLRDRIHSRSLQIADGVLGAGFTACVGLMLAWLVGAVTLHASQTASVRRDIQRSFVLRQLNDVMPPSGPLLNALQRFDPFPAIRGPSADVPAPRAAIARDPDVKAAADGVVRVLGTACGLGISGSGWIVADDLVVTNAHVVAGEDDTEVHLRGGDEGLPATAVAFDSRNDVAVLRVPGLGGTVLPMARDSSSGTAGAILGFPRNGPYDVRPARLGRTSTVRTEDAYGQGPVQRSIVSLRGLVRPGNSGGPVVDAAGRVITTVFAATVDSSPRGGFGVPNEVVREAVAGADSPVGTGSCSR